MTFFWPWIVAALTQRIYATAKQLIFSGPEFVALILSYLTLRWLGRSTFALHRRIALAIDVVGAKLMKMIGLLAGILVAFITSAVGILTILKDYLGVNTEKMLLCLGGSVATLISELLARWSIIVDYLSQGGPASESTLIGLMINIAVALMGSIVSFETSRRLVMRR